MPWSLNVQRKLPGSMLLEAGYIGNRGLQLMRNDESGLGLNQFAPRYMVLGSRWNDLVRNPFHGSLDSRSSLSNGPLPSDESIVFAIVDRDFKEQSGTA